MKLKAESRLIETILDWKQRGQRKGVLFLPLINCSLLPYFFPIVLIFRGCFDNRRNVASRFLSEMKFFFSNGVSLEKRKKEREGRKKKES